MYQHENRTSLRTRAFAVVFAILMVGSIVVPFAAVGEATQDRDGSDESLGVASIENQTATDENGHTGDASTDWPRFGGDDFNTGSTSAAGPVTDVGEAWSFPTFGSVQSSPAVVDDVVFFGSHDGHVYALDVEGGGERWRFDTGAKITSSPTVVDGVVYVGTQESDGDNVFAIDAARGTEQWAVEIGENAEVEFSSPAVDDGTLYIGTSRFMEDNLYALDSTDGSVEWSVELDGSGVLSSPVVVDGTVYVGSEYADHNYNVWAVDAVTGEKEPLMGAYGRAESSPTVVDDVLYIGTFVSGDDAHAFDLESGEKAWSFDTGDVVTSSPAVDDGVVYVGNAAQWSSDAHMYALNASPEWDGGTYENEDEKWRYSTDGGVLSSPAVADGVVYVGSQGGTVHAIDNDGSGVWDFETDGSVRSSPAVVDETVYVGSDDGRLYAIRDAPGTIATGQVDVTGPLTVESEEVTIDVSLEGTGTDHGYAIVRNAATGEGTALTLEGSGTYTVSTGALGGIDTDDDVQLTLYENETRQNRLAATQVTVLAPPATGTIELEEPILEDYNEFEVEYSFENTASGDAFVMVTNLETDEFVSEFVDENGSIDVQPENVGGIRAGDSIRAELYETPDGMTRLAQSTVTVEGDVADPGSTFFNVSIVSTNSPVTETESLTVEVAVENTGDAQGTQDVTLERFDGAVVDTTSVTLEEGDQETVTLEWETEAGDAGTGHVTVRSEETTDSEEVVVEAEPESGLEITDQYLSTDEIDVGENVTVTAVLENTGEEPDEIELSVEFDGVALYDEHLALDVDGPAADGPVPVTVEAGETETVELELTFNEPIDPNPIGVNGGLAGYLQVDGEDVPGPEPPSQIVIDEPGVYTLDGDFTADTSEAFVVIDADDVVLDGDGYTLKSESGGAGIAAENVENVTVRDLTLTGWQYGLQFEHVENALVEDVTAIDLGQSGLWLTTVTDSTVRNNDLIENRDGIVLRESTTGTLVEGNTVTENRRYGVAVRDSSENTLENNDVTGVDDHGFFLTHGTSENTLIGNTVTDSGSSWGDSGFHVRGDDNVLEDNVATGSYSEGFGIRGDGNALENNTAQDSGREGFRLVDANDNVLTNTTATGSDTHGIRFWNAVGNDLETVTAHDNGDWDVFFWDGSQDNTVSELTVGESVAETTLDVDGTDAGIEGVETVPPAPDDATPLDAYFVAAAEESGGSLTVEVPYEATDLEEVNEETLSLWRYDDAQEWSPVDDSSVDIDERVVTATLTSNSTFGVFGEAPQSELEVTETSLSDTSVDTGSVVAIDATVQNVGDTAGSQTVDLEVDGEVVDEEAVTLESGQTTDLTFTHQFDHAGEFDVVVAGEFVGTVTVSEPADNPEPAFFGVDLLETNAPVQAGDSLEVSATVENTGEEADTQSIELVAGGALVDSADVTLDEDETETVTLTWTTGADDVGEAIPLEVRSDDDTDTATVAVEEPAGDGELVVYGAEADRSHVALDETVTVSGDLYNGGDAVTTETVALEVDGEVVDEATASVPPGISRDGVELSWTPTAADLPDGEEEMNVTLTLDGFVVDTVTVEKQYSDVQVIAASVSEAEAVEGDELYVVGSLYQNGTIDGPEEIELTATNTETNETEVLGTREVTLEPGFYHLGALNVSFTPDEAGEYELALGDRNAGTIDVEPAESDVQVIAASVSEIEAVEGDDLYVVGSLYQNGTIDGPEEINLTATNTETNETEVLGSQEVSLAPGFYHLGALNVSFTPEEAGTYDIELGERAAGTIDVEAAESDIDVIAASVSEIEAVEGDDLYVVGSIYQGGNVEGPETIELTATNTETNETEVLETREVTLEPGFYHLGALNVSFTPEEAGTYDIELGERAAGTIDVEAAESDIDVIAASVSEVEAVEGDDLYVVGSLYQGGNVEGPETIELTATNTETNETEVLGTREVTLEPGFYHLGALNVSFTPEEAGTYDIELGDRHAGTIEVEEAYSDIDVIAASVSEVEAVEGEELYVTGSIYQGGNVEGPETIELTATHTETNETEVLGTREVTLEPGFYHLGALNVSFTLEEAGDYELELGDRKVGTITVDEVVTDIRVIGSSVSAVEVVEEESVHVTGSVYQNGSHEATETIELTATNTDTGESEVVGSQEVTLQPGYYHLGALNVTFVPDEAGTYDLELGDHEAGTVEVEPAESDVQVIAAGLSEIEAVEGDDLYVTGSIYQNGTIEGPEEIELTATNTDTGETEVVGSQEVTLEPGFYHLGALNVSFTPDEAGEYELELGDRGAGTVEVEPAESDVQVIAAGLSEVEAVEGDDLYVTGSIYQNGTIDGPETIDLTATNTDTGETEVVGSQEITLEPGFYHLGALNVSFSPDTPGTYELEFGERSAGTVEVVPAESDVDVIGASVSEIEAVEGDDLYVVGSIYQNGTIDGPEEIDLTATNTDTGETEVLGTREVTLEPGFYHLGALNVSFTIEEAGTYELELGDRNAGTLEVVEPTVEPTVVAVEGHSSGVDPETGADLAYASDEATVEIDVDADLDLEEVTLLVDSLETTYTVAADATHQDGDRWHASVPVDEIPDDGRYAISVIAVDEHGHAGMANADETLVIDRNEPSMAVSIEDVDGDDATVVVESDEPLTGTPEVSATFSDPEDGSTASIDVGVSPVDGNDITFTGTLEFDESGNYTVTAVGTDRAGNEGTDTASVVINTGFTLHDGEIVIDQSGTSIAFEVADDADEAIKAEELFLALSENTVNPNVDDADLGVGFITADLDSFLDHHLEQGTIEGATVSLAVDDSSLPGGASLADAQIHHYDQSTDQWDPVETDLEVVDGDPFLTSRVTHFSTYGALITDEEPPQLVEVETIEGDDSVTVRFEYEDAMSGVNVSAVSLSLDGTDVTRDGQITSSVAEYTVDGDTGSSHTVEVAVIDNAGNDATFETSVTVPGSDAPSDTTDPADEPGTEDDGERDDSVPGFGIVLTLIVLMMVSLAVVRLRP